MKNSFKNTFPLDGKKAFTGRGFKNSYKKWFALARKSVSTTRNEAFIENTFSLYGRTASSGKKTEVNGFHKQENIFF